MDPHDRKHTFRSARIANGYQHREIDIIRREKKRVNEVSEERVFSVSEWEIGFRGCVVSEGKNEHWNERRGILL